MTGPNTWEPERDNIRLRSVGCPQHKLSECFAQEGDRQSAKPATLEWLDGRQDDDSDHHDRRYLIDNTIEFLRMRISVEAEFVYPMRE